MTTFSLEKGLANSFEILLKLHNITQSNDDNVQVVRKSTTSGLQSGQSL